MSANSNGGLVWEEPSPKRGPDGGYWVRVLNQLMTRPGEWAVVYRQEDGESDQSARNHRNHMQGVAVRRGVRVETSTRIADGRVKVYARVLP